MKKNLTSIVAKHGSFISAFDDFFKLCNSDLMDYLPPRDRRGRSSLLSAEQLLCALSYHCIHGLGKLSSNVMRLPVDRAE